MSYAQSTNAGHISAPNSLSAMLGGLKDKFMQRRSYRETVNALSQLSNHELADLGLSRGSIQNDAWTAVYGDHQQR